jgi:hypothetical protein
MKRILLTMLGALLALVVAAPIASAQSSNGTAPEEFSATYSPEDVATLPGACDFPMQVEISGKSKTIEQGNGDTISIYPNWTVTVTNTDTDEEATFNVTGANHLSILENGNVQTVMTGRNFALDPVAGTFVSMGHFTFVNTPDNMTNVVPVSGTGRMIDVCALLAPPEEAE